MMLNQSVSGMLYKEIMQFYKWKRHKDSHTVTHTQSTRKYKIFCGCCRISMRRYRRENLFKETVIV